MSFDFAVAARKFSIEYEDDVTQLARFIKSGEIAADDVCAVSGHTEGDPRSTNTSRLAMDTAVRALLLDLGTRNAAAVAQIPMVYSAGDSGILSPNMIVWWRRKVESSAPRGRRLRLGVARTRDIEPEEIGRSGMIRATADGVLEGAEAIGVAPADVAFVLAKCNRLTPELAAEAVARGATTLDPTAATTSLASSGATALGVGVALGDIAEVPTDARILNDVDLWTARGSASSGSESPQTQLLVFGNASETPGTLSVGTAVLEDALDVRALYRAARQAGLGIPDYADPRTFSDRIVAVFVKCGADPAGRLRGHRQVMDGSNYAAGHKTSVGSIFAAALEDPAIYISAGAVHQGPVGGGSVAVVADLG